MRRAPLALALALALGAPALHAQPLPSAAYNAADWQLAWQAFLGNGDVESAYRLARAAVAARPHSILWHQRLAAAAEQSDHARDALEAYYWLVTHAHRHEYLGKALGLAEGLDDPTRAIPLMRIQLRARPYDERLWSGLIGELLKLGDYARALQLLQAADRKHPRRFFLWEQAVLYHQLGEPERELRTLESYSRRYGPEPKVMLQISTLLYLRGDYQGAYASLQDARPLATPQDTAYWRTLSGLAWLLGDYRVAAQASRVLYDADTAEPDDYRRLYLTQLHQAPKQAFDIALVGWRRTHQPGLFLNAVAAAVAAGKPAWLTQAYDGLPANEIDRLQRLPGYWTGLAALHASRNQLNAAQAAYARALAISPDDDQLWADDLWMLVDHHDRQTLSALLPKLSSSAGDHPTLWSPMAAGYALIGQPQHALPLLDRQWSRHAGDPAWLAAYADTAQQAGHPLIARRLRRHVFEHLAARPDTPARASAIQRDRLLASLATQLLPGDPARKWIAKLARQPRSAQARAEVLAWTLQLDTDDSARLWRQQAYGPSNALPAWARLSLALRADDASSAAALLSHDLDALPVQDAANAASTLGWTPLATQLYFDDLRDRSDAYDALSAFRPLALAGSDRIGTGLALMRASGLSLIDTHLAARHWLTPGLALAGRVDLGAQSAYDNNLLGPPPTASRQAQLALTRTLRRGSFSASLGGGRNLAGYLTAGAGWEYRWSRRLSTTASLAYGATPSASVPLQIGAREDRLELTASFEPTPRNALYGSFHTGEYRAQGGGYLGGITALSLDVEHRLWLSPPSLRISASLSGARFRRAARLPAQLAALVPAGETPDVGFFIPRDYAQACVGGGFNDRYQQDYTPLLRPFASANVCANSDYGPGYLATAGVALPVAGPDHLALSLQLGTNLGATGSTTQTLTLSYHYYFKPID